MRYLVTGGTGFVGRHVVRVLEGRGAAVTLLARRPVPDADCVPGDLAAGDLHLGGGAWDVVVHAAGLAHVVPRTDAEAARFTAVNTDGTRLLLQALERTGRLPDAFVFVSTVAVYGRERGEALDEATPCAAADPYGLSKRLAEEEVQAWGARCGVRVGIVRLPLVAGPGAPGNLRAMIDAIRRGRYLNIGGGTARRSMVRAADVAAVLPEVARAGGVFHLTDGVHPSFAALSAALAAALGRPAPRGLPLPLARVVARAGDWVEAVAGRRFPLNRRTLEKMTATLTFSDARAREQLGWNPTPVLSRIDELVSSPEAAPAPSSS